MATVYSNVASQAGTGTADLDNSRRVFNFGERGAELAPNQSPFFVYLSKIAKKATNDPVFKFLEQRHQWQRRDMTIEANVAAQGALVHGADTTQGMNFTCGYNQYGAIESNCAPNFLLNSVTIAVKADDGVVYRFLIDSDADLSKSGTDGTDGAVDIASGKMTVVGTTVPSGTTFSAGNKAQVIGSAFAEGTDAPTGWEDKLFDREGYCQIFKTGMNIFSGTAMATEYRGIANEYQRIWQDK